jgi:hypothetical protein
MNRFYLIATVATLLAGLTLLACTTPAPLPSTATPAEISAAKTAAVQADFDKACKYGGGVWQIVKPLASVPSIAVKIGVDGQLAVKALDTAVNVTCNTPLNITDGSAVTQRIYDAGGAVFALVIPVLSS